MKVHLPDEIVENILFLACTLPPLKDHSYREPSYDEAHIAKARSSAPHLDIPTTLKLLRLSPQHYSYIASILYKSPRLTDPISLSLFATTLSTRPALGRLVKHLWVGHAYIGEKLPVNTLSLGMGGAQPAYSLVTNIATIAELRKCLTQGVAPTGILSPEFEKHVARWAAFHVQTHARIVDTSRAPRGINIDAPGSGDSDHRGYHWIGINEWLLRLWDGRDLVQQIREVSQRAFWLQLKRLDNLETVGTPPFQSLVVPSHSTSLVDTDRTKPSCPPEPEKTGPRTTEHDAVDRNDSSSQFVSISGETLTDDAPIYSEDLDLEEIEAETDRCFLEMGVKKPTWRSQTWSEVTVIGEEKVEWWLIWLLVKARARARIAARRVWAIEKRENPNRIGWKPIYPRPNFNAKNHFTHPTLFARSGASHLLIGGAPQSERNDVWNTARRDDNDHFTSSDYDSESQSSFCSESSDYESEHESGHASPPAGQTNASIIRGQNGSNNRTRLPLATFSELEMQKAEDQADLWGGESNFANGNERAGAGSTVIGSRGGMFGFDSALRRGALDEPDEGLDSGNDFCSLQQRQIEAKNKQDGLLSKMTLGSVLSSLRAILMLAPKLGNLAVDGVFERTICGRRSMCNMGKLKSLSLGPPPPYWSSPLLFGHPLHVPKAKRRLYHEASVTHEREMGGEASAGSGNGSGSSGMFPMVGILIPSPAFSTLRTLHISGCMLFPSEAKAIGGYGGQLPNLRHFRWSLWQPHLEGHPASVVETLCAIMNIPALEEEAAAAAAAAEAVSGSGSGASTSNLGTVTSSGNTADEPENRKRRRRNDDSLLGGNSVADVAANHSSLSNHASLLTLLTRKRKLHSVYATLHPSDEAIIAIKAPPALRFDPRLKIETSQCQDVADNLVEMNRWWEWESGMMSFEPNLSNLDALNAQSEAAAKSLTTTTST